MAQGNIINDQLFNFDNGNSQDAVGLKFNAFAITGGNEDRGGGFNDDEVLGQLGIHSKFLTKNESSGEISQELP